MGPVTALRLLALATVVTAPLGCDEPEPAPQPSVSRLVDLSVRRSAVDGSEGVLQLHNISGRHLAGVVLDLSNLDSRRRVEASVDLDPGETKEFGWVEGWAVSPRDLVIVSKEGHRAIALETFRADGGAVGIRPSEKFKEFDELARRAIEAERAIKFRQKLWGGAAAAAALLGLGAWLGRRGVAATSNTATDRPTSDQPYTGSDRDAGT